MGPIAYALCQKPVIGPVMWLLTLCAFDPPFSGVPLALDTAGTTAKARFTVPVDQSYPLLLSFTFPDERAYRADQVVGERYDGFCDGRPYAQIPAAARDGLGQPIPLRVVIRRAGDDAVVFERTDDTLCVQSYASWDHEKMRHVVNIPLTRGEYTATITNTTAQPGLAGGVKTTLVLAGGRGK